MFGCWILAEERCIVSVSIVDLDESTRALSEDSIDFRVFVNGVQVIHSDVSDAHAWKACFLAREVKTSYARYRGFGKVRRKPFKERIK